MSFSEKKQNDSSCNNFKPIFYMYLPILYILKSIHKMLNFWNSNSLLFIVPQLYGKSGFVKRSRHYS